MKPIYYTKSILLMIYYSVKSFNLMRSIGAALIIFSLAILNQACLPDAPKMLLIAFTAFLVVGSYITLKFK